MLKDEKIILRKLQSSECKKLAELANNKKISDNLRDLFPFPYSTDNALFFYDLIKAEDPRLTFAIEHTGELCGIISLVPQTDIYRGTAEIGYWLGEPFWGMGIATRAVKLITGYGLHVLNFTRIHTGVFETNPASMKVLEKNGYMKEGIFKKAITKNNRVMDEHRFAITK